MRLVPPTDTRVAEAITEQTIDLTQKEVPEVEGHYIVIGDRPYVEKDNGSPLPELLRKTCDQVTGRDMIVGSSNGYMDTAVAAGTLGGHNCMSYGSGSLELAYKPDEFIPYEDMCRCREVL